MNQERPGRRGFVRTSAGTAVGRTLSSVLPRSILGGNDRLRVGLIGGGNRGTYLRGETLKIAGTHDVEVSGLCDVWKVNRERTADRLDPRVGGEGPVRNWIESGRSRQAPTAPIDVGHAHSVVSIMCFKSWESGRRQVYDSVRREIHAG